MKKNRKDEKVSKTYFEKKFKNNNFHLFLMKKDYRLIYSFFNILP